MIDDGRIGTVLSCKSEGDHFVAVVAVGGFEGEVVTPVYGSITINVTSLPKFAESLGRAKESLRRYLSIRPVIKMIDGDLDEGAIDA